MRIGQRGADLLRTAGISTTIAGIALMSLGTLSASATSISESDAPFTMASTPSVIQGDAGTSLKDTIVLTKHVGEDITTTSTANETTTSSTGVGKPLVSLSSGDCDTDKDTDEDAEKDKSDSKKEDVVVEASLSSTVVHVEDSKVWTATTEGVAVKLGDGDSDFHFTVIWNGVKGCEDVTVSKVVPTPAPTATPVATATPTPAPTATPTPAATTSATSAVAAVSAVKTPSTGADVPTAAGLVLMMSGLGLLLGGLRRRRNSQ
jgi:hypothetical protein